MKKTIQVIYRHRLMNSITGLRPILFLLYNHCYNDLKMKLQEMEISICFVSVYQLYLWNFHVIIG